jgi:hypothetical protein
MKKTAYICGALTELDDELKPGVKLFYEHLADLVERLTGARAFVPHEHYDPDLHRDYTPQQVDEAERAQVCEHTSCLIVVAICPSWGGGIEVEMAYRSGVPIIILHPEEKTISRLLRGNPGVKAIIPYLSEADALYELERLWSIVVNEPVVTPA